MVNLTESQGRYSAGSAVTGQRTAVPGTASLRRRSMDIETRIGGKTMRNMWKRAAALALGRQRGDSGLGAQSGPKP